MVSEIRESTRISLIDKVRRNDYGKYLYKVHIAKVRGFSNESVSFDFPVTALIGPNGSGKSSILGIAGCAYKPIKPGIFFPKSAIGDESMSGWRAEYEIIDKYLNARQSIRRTSSFRQAKWVRGDVADRDVLFFGIERTVPAGEKSRYKKLQRSTYKHVNSLESFPQNVAKQIEHILGKSVDDFKITSLGHDDDFLVGMSGGTRYSEFHFGAGESSIIRMVAAIEAASLNSLVLIEEIENGLHPVATQRMVEYLIDVAERKSIQAIFTTHSDSALSPLPNEAIWACIDGKLQQGKLSVNSLRAVSGRVDSKLAIFVEDAFAKHWVEMILREGLGSDFEQIEVHSVAGDGNAVKTHKNHMSNPAVQFESLCILDGDSKQMDDLSTGIIRLPGAQPEITIYEDICGNLPSNIAILTVSCQRAPDNQTLVETAVNEVLRTNRDPHLLFNQLGIKIGFVPEAVVRGAFLALWTRHNSEFCATLTSSVKAKLAA